MTEIVRARKAWRIFVATLKGGCTKSTTAMLLALYYASLDLTVVVICADTKHRSATKWTNRIHLRGEEPPYIYVKWAETDGPLATFAAEQEEEFQPHIVIIDGGNEKETFTQGCLWADDLVSPVAPVDGELDGIPDTYKFAKSVMAYGSLKMWVLLTRSPSRNKGASKRSREELTSSPKVIDPETPWTLGLDVLTAEISKNMAYSDMYGTVPDDVFEYVEVGKELLKLRDTRIEEAVSP